MLSRASQDGGFEDRTCLTCHFLVKKSRSAGKEFVRSLDRTERAHFAKSDFAYLKILSTTTAWHECFRGVFAEMRSGAELSIEKMRQRAQTEPRGDLCHYLPYQADLSLPAAVNLEKQVRSGKVPMPDGAALDEAATAIREDAATVFDKRRFHPELVRVARPHFAEAQFRQAVFEACKLLNAQVREKSGVQENGTKLMAVAFAPNRPVLRWSDLQTDEEKDEQQGWLLLYHGAMLAIRNPKTYDEVQRADRIQVLEILSFLDLLLRKLDQAYTA